MVLADERVNSWERLITSSPHCEKVARQSRMPGKGATHE
jgi:hypothetical protein